MKTEVIALAQTGNGNIWLTVVLPIWIVCGLAVLINWMLTRRKLKNWDRPAVPELVAAGRRLYDDGEFMRDIVKRTPVRLSSDAFELSCGHKTETFRNDDTTKVNCHQCAQEWIDRQSALERKR
jgi:hypothetical protein